MEPLVGRNIDRYVVEKLLGRGAMAAVYRVRHRTLNTLHALKVLTLAGDRVRERLVQEGQVQAQLRHPNVLSVTDVLDVDGAPGLLMEFIDGPTLEDYAAAHKPNIEQAEALFRGVLLGVAEAHSIGLVHRDLKPANVLVANSSRGPVPKVADFGLAKLLADEESGGGMHRTRSGSTMGTPAYMAPEQIRDAKHVDHRADIFSLGAILYELIAGRRPFDGEDILAVFNAVATGTYAPLVGAPDRVVLAVSGSLMVKRDDRIPDCDTFIDVLDGKRSSWSDVALRRRVHSFGGPSTGGSSSVVSGSSPSALGSSGQVSPQANSPQPMSVGAALAGSATVDPSMFSSDDSAPLANSLATMDPAGGDFTGGDFGWQTSGVPGTQVPPATLGSVPEFTSETIAPPLATRAAFGVAAANTAPNRHIQVSAGQTTDGSPSLAVPEGTQVHVVGKTEGKGGKSSAWIMVLSMGGVVSIAVVAALALFFVNPAAETKGALTEAAVAIPAAPVAEKTENPEPPAPVIAKVEPAVTTNPTTSPVAPPVVAKATPEVVVKPSKSAGTSTTDAVAKPAVVEPVAVEAPVAETGALVVSSVPFGSASIDGVAKGKSGKTYTVPVGKRSVTIKTDDGRTITRSVTVTAEKGGYFCWDFEVNAECD